VDSADSGGIPRLPNVLGDRVDGLGKKAKKAEAKIEEGWEGFKERPLAVIKDVASYGQGVWVRLNGGGRSTRKGAAAVLDTLPAARSSKQEHEARMVSLALEAEEARSPFSPIAHPILSSLSHPCTFHHNQALHPRKGPQSSVEDASSFVVAADDCMQRLECSHCLRSHSSYNFMWADVRLPALTCTGGQTPGGGVKGPRDAPSEA
jgi:hypothetical protein